jgi:hypothetical protein
MPLAAAAAIGVIAIGVVQQMPKETAIDVTSDATVPHPGPLPASGARGIVGVIPFFRTALCMAGRRRL